jgi:hypothetical protein
MALESDAWFPPRFAVRSLEKHDIRSPWGVQDDARFACPWPAQGKRRLICRDVTLRPGDAAVQVVMFHLMPYQGLPDAVVDD